MQLEKKSLTSQADSRAEASTRLSNLKDAHFPLEIVAEVDSWVGFTPSGYIASPDWAEYESGHFKGFHLSDDTAINATLPPNVG